MINFGIGWLFYVLFLFFSEEDGGPDHVAAVIAASFLLLLLAVAAVVYSRCHLNIKLWYRNSYGEYELNGEVSVEEISNVYNHA